MKDNVINLDDYREVWTTKKINCKVCNKLWQAVFVFDTEFLECPKCGVFINGQVDFNDEMD